MDELGALGALAKAMGVHTHYTDGLGRSVTVAPDTLLRVCAALGAPVERPADAAAALRALDATRDRGRFPNVLVAWDGVLEPVALSEHSPDHVEMLLEDGEAAPLEIHGSELRATQRLPLGYHRLTIETSGEIETCTVIAAPVHAWRRTGAHRSWGVGAQLAALCSARSRSLGDLRDLEATCRWVDERGGDPRSGGCAPAVGRHRHAGRDQGGRRGPGGPGGASGAGPVAPGRRAGPVCTIPGRAGPPRQELAGLAVRGSCRSAGARPHRRGGGAFPPRGAGSGPPPARRSPAAPG